MKAVRVLLFASLLPCGALAQAPHDPAAPAAGAAVATPEPEPYSPAGRRDPFRPFLLDIRPEARPQLTPLQRYELGQLTVVATVWEASTPRALVEDSSGMGYIIGVGTPIGRNGGVVTAIEPQRVIVEERRVDFYGNQQVNRIVMETPREDLNQPVRERR